MAQDSITNGKPTTEESEQIWSDAEAISMNGEIGQTRTNELSSSRKDSPDTIITIIGCDDF